MLAEKQFDKFSKRNRIHNALVKQSSTPGQTRLTDFDGYSLIQSLESLLEDNESIAEVLRRNILETTAGRNEHMGPLLQSLLEASKSNKNKSAHGWRFEELLKKFSTLLYLLSGKKSYVMLYSNLKSSLPSLSTVKRLIDEETSAFKAGVVRVKELKNWLAQRNLKFRVSLAEDLTKITESIQYNPKANCLEGLSPPLGCNGFPKIDQFPARNEFDIKTI